MRGSRAPLTGEPASQAHEGLHVRGRGCAFIICVRVCVHQCVTAYATQRVAHVFCVSCALHENALLRATCLASLHCRLSRRTLRTVLDARPTATASTASPAHDAEHRLAAGGGVQGAASPPALQGDGMLPASDAAAVAVTGASDGSSHALINGWRAHGKVYPQQ